MENMTKQLKIKVEKDFNEFTNKFDSRMALIDNAYTIAIANEVYCLLTNEYGDLLLDLDFEEEEVLKMANYKGNIIELAIDTYMGYNHPERTNIFCELEDLIELVKCYTLDCID